MLIITKYYFNERQYNLMPKKYEVQKFILQALERKDLSKMDLLHNTRKESGFSISDKTLNESLIHLLRQNKVGVVGYDLAIYDGIKRVQSMKADGIIFSRFKNDPFEVGILIGKLESEDIEDARKAMHRLKMIFKNKISTLSRILNQIRILMKYSIRLCIILIFRMKIRKE